jgi:hypothetical protein
MAITNSIPFGSPLAILQNVVMALPPAPGMVLALAAVEHSVDGATFVALAGSATTGANTPGGFIRCTTGNTTVIVKRLS